MTKRVFQLVSDGCETEDDVGCGDSAGDGNPAERFVELEWQEIDVEENDLGDEDVVANGQRGGEDALGGGLGVG